MYEQSIPSPRAASQPVALVERAETIRLRGQIEALSRQNAALRAKLGAVRCLDAYASEADVIAALDQQLGPWTCRRWRRLAGLVKARACREGP